MSKIIVVTGVPASGKTVFAQKVGNKFNLPLFSKDSLKELLFDYVGVENRDLSRKFGMASFELLYEITEQLMRTDVAHVIEGNFDREFASNVLNKKMEKYDCEFLQFNFYAQKNIIRERFEKRWDNRNVKNSRHKGHMDNENLEIVENTGGKNKALDIPGELIEVDTTNFDNVDYKQLNQKISEFLK
ncbi:MAG: AAA family ATPase [Candidatus Moraniibacteriota bacterium]|jgi:predicted kinase